MKRACIIAFLSVLVSAAAAQNVKVKLCAALYDRDLNVKPVPHLVVKLVPAAPGAQPMTVQTTLDGVAEVDLPAGKYKIVTEKPVELFDKSYRWEFDADFIKPENTLELSNDPVLVVAAVPKTKMPFWENMASGSGSRGPVIRRYKTAVEKLRLLGGDKELTPIWPARLVAGMGFSRGVVLADESSMGRYVYPHDAVSPQCGKVTLQIFSTKDPEHPLEKVLDESVVTRIWQDFEPYRKIQAQQAGAAPPR